MLNNECKYKHHLPLADYVSHFVQMPMVNSTGYLPATTNKEQRTSPVVVRVENKLSRKKTAICSSIPIRYMNNLA
jgi:hypothetical protein